MFCKRCGNEIQEGVSFCPNCGTKVDVTQDSSPAEKNIEENSENADNSVIKKRNSHGKFIAVIGSLVAVLAICAGGIIYLNQPQNLYDRADKAFENENYDKAIKLYTKLENYSDAEQKLSMAITAKHYKNGKDALADADYDLAIEELAAANGYMDEEELIKEARYKKGIILLDAGDYDGAAELLILSEDYGDAKEKRGEIGNHYVEVGEYQKALYVFGDEYKSNGYYQYAQGMIYYENGGYNLAAPQFQSAKGTLDADDMYLDACYKAAEMYFKEGNYSTASIWYQKNPSYKDSNEKIDICGFKQADQEISKGNLNNAKRRLEKLPQDLRGELILGNKSVSEVLELLNQNKEWVDLCGKWVSTSGKMKSTASGLYYYWYRDIKEGDYSIDVRCVLGADGSVRVIINGDVDAYNTYSILKDLMSTEKVYITVNETMKMPYTAQKGDYTVKVEKGKITFNYKKTEIETVSSKYTYTTDIVYGKRTEEY